MGPQGGSWYEIEPCPAAVGEGWGLRLSEPDLERGEVLEVGGSLFPVKAYLEDDQNFWDLASNAAYADALKNAPDWLDIRSVVGTV